MSKVEYHEDQSHQWPYRHLRQYALSCDGTRESNDQIMNVPIPHPDQTKALPQGQVMVFPQLFRMR